MHSDAGQRATIRLAGATREVCERLGVTDMLLSSAHCRSHATAYVMAVNLATWDGACVSRSEGSPLEE